MKCSRIRKMITPYLDGELGPDEKKVVAYHLGECPGCKEKLEEMQSIHRLLASAERFKAPPGFATRVMARIGTLEQAPSSFWSFFTLQPTFVRAMEVAFALVILLVGMISGNLLIADKTVMNQPTLQESFSLDLFQATPSDSIGGTYMRLAGLDHER